jgi:serine/threonine protein kinase
MHTDFTKKLTMWVLKSGDLFDKRYRIQREIGTGGMSFVYAAEDEELKETVALKIIRPELVYDDELVERFKREVRIARQILHPNIIRVFEFGRAEVEGKVFFYLTMELLTGVDLASWLKRRGAISLNEILEVSLQICDALAEAHRHGVIHRDIKPHNIFIDETGRATLMDFGISRLAHLPGLTDRNYVMGTPRYMSPEQVGGKGEIDHRSDLYSFGIVLYELCTQTVPFSGQTPVEVALQHIQEPPKPPRRINAGVPIHLETAIMTCLQKSPDARFSSADELLAELKNIARETRVTPPLAVKDKQAKKDKETQDDGKPAPAASRPFLRPDWTVIRKRAQSFFAENKISVILLGGLVSIGILAVLVTLLILSAAGRSPEASTTPAAEGPTTGSIPAEISPATSSVEPTTSPSSPVPNEDLPTVAGGLGSVVIAANPGTRIYVNDEYLGTVPPVVSLDLGAGPHRIRYVIPEYDNYEETVEVVGGQKQTFSHHFQAFGLLRVVCRPEARVRLDGEDIGSTPLDIKRIREGEHRLVLYRDGYRTIEDNITIRLGRPNLFRYALIPR